MKVVVTGASGFLGSYVMAELGRREHTALGWSHGPAQGCLAIDLTQQDLVEAALTSTRPDAVIHLAAVSDIGTCKKDPDLARKMNASVAGELARLASRHSLRLVHVSTEVVFDGSDEKLREEDKPRPQHIYGESKLQGEKKVAEGYKEAAIVRPSLCTGAAPPGRRSSTSWLLHELRKGQQPRMFTDEIRSPVASSDVARALVDLVEIPEVSGLVHCGGNEALTRYELACREAEAAGVDSSNVLPTTREELGFASERPAKLVLDSSRLIGILGWTPHA